MTAAQKTARLGSLQNTIDNFVRRDMGGDQRCLDARDEMDRLQSGGLGFSVSLAAIRDAAALGHFISYGTLADASGVDWKRARRPIYRHLEALCVWANDQGFPLITAVVVEKDCMSTGHLSEGPLAGFLRAAEVCGVPVPEDKQAFVREQQMATFRWAGFGVAP